MSDNPVKLNTTFKRMVNYAYKYHIKNKKRLGWSDETWFMSITIAHRYINYTNLRVTDYWRVNIAGLFISMQLNEVKLMRFSRKIKNIVKTMCNKIDLNVVPPTHELYKNTQHWTEHDKSVAHLVLLYVWHNFFILNTCQVLIVFSVIKLVSQLKKAPHLLSSCLTQKKYTDQQIEQCCKKIAIIVFDAIQSPMFLACENVYNEKNVCIDKEALLQIIKTFI